MTAVYEQLRVSSTMSVDTEPRFTLRPSGLTKGIEQLFDPSRKNLRLWIQDRLGSKELSEKFLTFVDHIRYAVYPYTLFTFLTDTSTPTVFSESLLAAFQGHEYRTSCFIWNAQVWTWRMAGIFAGVTDDEVNRLRQYYAFNPEGDADQIGDDEMFAHVKHFSEIAKMMMMSTFSHHMLEAIDLSRILFSETNS